MMKTVGIVLIVTASTMIGMQFSGKLSSRIVKLQTLAVLIRNWKTEIRYRSTPIGELILQSAGQNQYRHLPFLKKAAEMLETQRDVQAVWEQSIQQQKKKMGLKQEDITLLLSFGKQLGNSDVEGQITGFSLYETQLESLLEQARLENGKKGKMYTTLGTLFGMAIGIFLL